MGEGGRGYIEQEEEEEEVNDGRWWRLVFVDIKLWKGSVRSFFVRWLVYPFDRDMFRYGCTIHSQA